MTFTETDVRIWTGKGGLLLTQATEDSKYQLWAINREDSLRKFMMCLSSFNSIEEAITFADDYLKKQMVQPHDIEELALHPALDTAGD